MKKTDYYLAHPFDSRKWVREWQLKIQRSSNIKIANPFYSKYRNDVETWDHKDSSGNKIYEKLNSDDIVSRDLELIRRQEKGTIELWMEVYHMGQSKKWYILNFMGRLFMLL